MIASFTGSYRFLSNFHPCVVWLDGVSYPTVEHAYQAAKTEDASERAHVKAAPTPGEAKRRGRRVAKRRDWDSVKLDVMEHLLRQKFGKGSADLRMKLFATIGHELVEGNTWGDTFWGVCGGRGSNHLGRLLMEIRDGG